MPRTLAWYSPDFESHLLSVVHLQTEYLQKFEYLLFCAILVHLIGITGESGHPGASVAFYVLDLVILSFYL